MPRRVARARLASLTAAAFATSLAVGGCASMGHRSSIHGAGWQTIEVESDPAGAEVMLDGERVGETPTRLAVKRRRTDAVLRMRKAGFTDAEVPLSAG